MSSTRDEDARNKRLFDIRTVERNIKKGLITRKDYEKYVKSLADVSALVAPPDTVGKLAPPIGLGPPPATFGATPW